MKIAVFSEKFWPEGSGGELATYLILKLLASTGDFELEVYTGTQKPAQVPCVSMRRVEFLRASNKIQLYLNILRNKRYVERAVERTDLIYIPRFSYPIIPIAKKLNGKVVVHLHDYQPISYTSVILSMEIDKPISDFRRTLILESKSGSLPRTIASTLATPLTKLIRRWVGMADRIICVSQRHEEILLKLAPEYKRKTITIYNLLPEVPDIQKDASEKPMLLYVGGDSYIKGFYVLLEALRILGRRGRTNFKLILTNKYSQKSLKTLNRLKKTFGLDIEVFGRTSHEELLKLYSKAWALLFPSIWEEPLPYAIVESVMNRTIPLASNVGGILEILGEKARQFLVTPGDARGLANKMEALAFKDANEICELGTSVSEHACRKFNSEDTAKKFAAILMGHNPGE